MDWAAFRRAMSGPETDTRHWIAYGTVASVNGEDGTANYTDPNAVIISPASIDVDVVLEPHGYPIPCQYGMQAGSVFIATPIRPGDQVVVLIPDGEVSMVPQILRVITGASDPSPVGDDGLPVFQNDRLLVFAKDVPLDLRAGNARALLQQDGTVTLFGEHIELGGAAPPERLVKGDTQSDAEKTLNADPLLGLIHWFDTLATAAVGPLAGLQLGLQGIKAALQVYEQKRSTFLSDVSKTR